MDVFYQAEMFSHSDNERMTGWFSAVDGGYVGQDKFKNMLETRGIAPQLRDLAHNVCSVGFCAKENKWYGWSHRAIYGFGIGSEVKKGDCAYMPADEEAFREKYLEFFGVNEFHKDEKVVDHTDENGERGALITATYTDDVPNEKLRGTKYEVFWPYRNEKMGRGEWTAKTMEDAKQMAMDFAEGVS